MKALLIVGMQVDLLPGGPAEVPDSPSLIPFVNEAAAKFGLLTAALFHLPANHLAFAGNHPWRHPGQTIDVEGVPTLLRNIFCVPGTFGAEWIPGLETTKIAFTAEMGTMPLLAPHSAFFDAEKRRDTGLLAFLKEKKVTELYLAGIPLEDEVKNTSLDSQRAGFRTFLIRNASSGRIPEAEHAALTELQHTNIEMVFSHQL